MRKKKIRQKAKDARHDGRLTVIEALPAPDDYHTIVEAWAMHAGLEPRLMRFRFVIDAVHEWIDFGYLIGREDENTMRIYPHEDASGYTVPLRGEIRELLPLS